MNPLLVIIIHVYICVEGILADFNLVVVIVDRQLLNLIPHQIFPLYNNNIVIEINDLS